MKRPLAYITAAWSGDPCEATEQAAKYCRAVYEAGFLPAGSRASPAIVSAGLSARAHVL